MNAEEHTHETDELEGEAREDDFITNESGNKPFAEVLEANVRRRSVIRGGLAGAAAFLGGTAAASAAAAQGRPPAQRPTPSPAPPQAPPTNPTPVPPAPPTSGRPPAQRPGATPVATPVPPQPAPPVTPTPPPTTPASGLLGNFTAIPTTTADAATVPPEYSAYAIVPWGDPINPSGPAFKQDASNTAEEQEQQLGMGHDGMYYFPLGAGAAGSQSGLLAINHEYTVGKQLFPDGRDNWTAEKTRKEQAGHGMSVVQVGMDGSGSWSHVESDYARRIHVNTPCQFGGPATGHRLLKTAADPAGTTPVGILNQCGNGYTPWGTYLTTEENFNGYFWEETEGAAAGISDEQAAMNARYGVAGQGFGYLWATTDDRFRADLTPQEPNRFGWMVEVDPYAPNSAPMKRTAMGRFKHEGAAFATSRRGQAVVYMGDDQRFDYIYKFVGANSWRRDLSRGVSPLDEGTLYVARFDEGGTGAWLPLVHGMGPLTAANGFADQGEVLIKARMAADALGATPMDRPEWTAVHPFSGDVYCTLTNNSRRTEPNAANPRFPNPWGHIIRWSERDHADTTFEWDIYLFAGPGDGVDGSTVDAEDMLGSPDGLWIDDDGRMWIQTDGGQPDGSNNQMLVGDADTGELKRFFVGPVDCEVTGVTVTPDGTTMFINIQHPGDGGPAENPTETSNWPDGPGAGRPRPATVVIRRNDGGVIGT